MNHIKKLFLLIICLWAFLHFGISQNENSDKKKSSVKPFYVVEANFGISSCKEIRYNEYKHKLETKLFYKTLVYGANFSGGIELAHYFNIGAGIGYLYYKQEDNGITFVFNPYSKTTHGVPLFLYLRSYFVNKKASPFIDFKIGNNFLITKETVCYNDNFGHSAFDAGNFRLKNGLFLATDIGIPCFIKPKATYYFSIGYRYVSRVHDFPYEVHHSSEKDAFSYRKTGFVIADHQFVLNIGVTF
jgi:hypothetical protein